MLLYQKRAELNLLAQKIYKMFGKQTSFKVIVFTTPKQESDLGSEENLGLTANVKKETGKMLSKLKLEMTKNQLIIQGFIKTNDSKNDTLMKAQEAQINQHFGIIEKIIQPIEDQPSTSTGGGGDKHANINEQAQEQSQVAPADQPLI